MLAERTVPVSVVIMTKNEAANINRCLDSVAWVDQVFVVDSHSTDATADIARAKGATLVPFSWNGQYPKKKQWCLDHLLFRHDWVFFLDADEAVTPKLAEEIRQVLAKNVFAKGYYIPGQPVFLGRALRFGQWNKKLALIRRRHAHFPVCDDLDITSMWEVEGHYQPAVDGIVRRLTHPVLHADAKSFYTWIDRHNRYSDWESAMRARPTWKALHTTETPLRRVLKTAMNKVPGIRPWAAFVYSYFIRLGFLDGRAGLHYALSRAFYYWMIAVKEREKRVS